MHYAIPDDPSVLACVKMGVGRDFLALHMLRTCLSDRLATKIPIQATQQEQGRGLPQYI